MLDSSRSGNRFIQGESGLAVARNSHPRHPYPIYLHKEEAKDVISYYAVRQTAFSLGKQSA